MIGNVRPPPCATPEARPCAPAEIVRGAAAGELGMGGPLLPASPVFAHADPRTASS